MPLHLRGQVIQVRFNPFDGAASKSGRRINSSARPGAATNNSTPKPIPTATMTAPINPPELDIALKTLCGAGEMPFGAAVQTPYASDPFKQTRHRLEQLVSVRACGLLHGPNGVGKTLLVQHFLKSLPDKRYKPLVLSHSSITGTDLLRLLCLELGQTGSACAAATTSC